MKIEIRKFRIGTLAEKLNVERFVIRFWEKEFNIRPNRSTGQQRFYTEKDLERFSAIKELLYDKGFTIAGAKKHLKTQTAKPAAAAHDEIVASHITTMEPETSSASTQHSAHITALTAHVAEQMIELQKKLIKLRELL